MSVEKDCICSLCNVPPTPPLPDMELAEMVKTLRTQMGLTQEELARRSGLEQSTISAIEHQKRGYRWSRRTLEKFARGFGKKLVVRFE